MEPFPSSYDKVENKCCIFLKPASWNEVHMKGIQVQGTQEEIIDSYNGNVTTKNMNV